MMKIYRTFPAGMELTMKAPHDVYICIHYTFQYRRRAYINYLVTPWEIELLLIITCYLFVILNFLQLAIQNRKIDKDDKNFLNITQFF